MSLNDFFKQNAHLLDEMPPQSSWNALSHRLRKEKRRRRVIRALNTGMAIAASLLLVVNILWIYSEVIKRPSNSFLFIENYSATPQNTSSTPMKELAPQSTSLLKNSRLTNNSKKYKNFNRPAIQTWTYGDNTPKNIKELSAITGAWVLPVWYQLDQYKNIPNTINVFHTNDDKYYLNMDSDSHEAYLMQAIRAVDKFNVLHPQINVIDNSNNTVLIVYFDSGLIVDYQRKDKMNNPSLL